MKFHFDLNLVTFALAAVAAVAAPVALAQPDPSLAEVSVPRLQGMVVQCDLSAPKQQPQTATEAFCAFAADELRRRAFDGDSERLLAWWREQRAAARAVAEGPAAPASSLNRTTPAQPQSAYERLLQTALLEFANAVSCGSTKD